MRTSISRQFLAHYLVVSALVLLSTAFAVSLLSLSSRIAANAFAKNRYPASAIMRDDYHQIEAESVVRDGGSITVIDRDYRVVRSEGKDAMTPQQLTAAEFTDFLVWSKHKNTPFHHDILYSPTGEFWLIVTFPASIRIDWAFILNTEAAAGDLRTAVLILAGVIAAYLLLIFALTALYSIVTAVQITVPLRRLCEGTRLLREGNYAARVDLHLKNEFAELQDTFNSMAARIDREIALRQKSEDDRRQLILDISHDLKNPMASIQGYAEHICQKPNMSREERDGYLRVISQNVQRANGLLTELFELSQMDSPEFSLRRERVDLCELLRQQCGELVPQLERAGFQWEFDIPEESTAAMVDRDRFGRLMQNLASNALRYNPPGTTIAVSLKRSSGQAFITFRDDGVGIPEHLKADIFKPFVRADSARSSETGGSGLGLSIAKRIAEAHGGELSLLSDGRKGSAFLLVLPTI
ncbi:MAG: HAMP domain-containing histidine kinase [Firmicutes bacterium]|jgi:signal transduction histidine kinase|nr:HAMP domain-containing histidine kinase [Bacillota bacterium]